MMRKIGGREGYLWGLIVHISVQTKGKTRWEEIAITPLAIQAPFNPGSN